MGLFRFALRLLYNKVGLAPLNDTDPYAEPYGVEHRAAVKRAFTVMINAKGQPNQNSVPEFSEAKLGITWKQFLKGIQLYHLPVSQFFQSGYGTKLQRLDANVTEAVLLRFVRMQQPCLAIHDSFITLQTLEDELPNIMREEAIRLLNLPLDSKLVFSSQYEGPIGEVSMQIDLETLEKEQFYFGSNLILPKSDKT